MKVGVQTYTVRAYTQNEKDFARTAQRIAAMGSHVIQLSGAGPIKPATIQKICQDNGLQIVLTHNPEKAFLEDPEGLMEAHRIYNCKYIGLGCMPERYRSLHWIGAFAEDYGPVAELLHKNGFHFMYHNHALEFEHLEDGSLLMDHLLAGIPAELMGITADSHWLQMGGVNPADWYRKYADRVNCVHFKDFLPVRNGTHYAPIGEGNLDFPGIIEALKDNPICEYALIEQDDCYGASPFDCLQSSIEYLKKLGCEL